MAFSGGSADKVGNEYETWWTLRRVAQLIHGDIQALSIEPLGGDGAELWVEARGVRTFDQVKYRSTGNWTPGRLRSDGLLAKLGVHYASGAQVLLVLSQPANELHALIDLARATLSGDELWSVAGTKSNDLDLLADVWGTGREATRAYLSQTSVRHDGLPHLREYVELLVETLVIGDAALAIGVLRDLLADRLNSTIVAADVWEALNRAGFLPRPRVMAGPTSAKLRAALDRHTRSLERTTPAAGTIGRREVGEIVDSVLNSSVPALLVSGKAGAGKSIVAAQAAEELARRGRHVTAVRLDRLDPTTSTANQLGVAIDLDGSPVVSVSEVASGGPDGVLLIDQLDAVSSYSGRMPHVFDAVDDALSQARLLGNVKVILVVRAIDLAEDPRLRKLAGDDAPTVEIGELDREDVESYLSRMGVAVSQVDASTLALITLPIHLYVFCGLDPELRSGRYQTLTSLYDAFTRSFRTRLDHAGYGDEWPEVSKAMVERMNVDEALSVPKQTLDHVRQIYVAALVSENVLVEQDGRFGLFHETFFDHLFARSFDARGHALVEWFASTGQSLFRRSQLRQLLNFIANNEATSFLEQVLLVAAGGLRPHLTAIAYSALAEFTPRPDSWLQVRGLLTLENPFHERVLSLLSAPQWFDAADQSKDLDSLLDSPDWGEAVASQVARVAAECPERVLELLKPRIGRGPVWVRAVRMAIDIADDPSWVDYVCEQINDGGLDLPDEPFDLLQTSLIRGLAGRRPLDALRVLVAALQADAERVTAEEQQDLAEALSRRRGHLDISAEFNALASEIAPQFVDALLPLIERVATHGSAANVGGWRYRFKDRTRTVGDEIYFAFDRALTKLARDDWPTAAAVVERLSSHKTNSLDFLACRAIRQGPADRAVDWVLGSQDRFDLGWTSSYRWESRRLIEAAGAACSDDRFTQLEKAILFWTPDYEKTARNLPWRGWSELELLSALPAGRLTESAARRLAELHRKFPDWRPEEPSGLSGGSVQSPISQDAAERMTDAQWVRAMRKYGDRDSTTFRGAVAYGGAYELSSLLGTIANKEPERFLNLALQLDQSIPAIYTERIIRGVAGEIDQSALLGLLRNYRSDHPEQSASVVIEAIGKYEDQIDDELLALLVELSADADPSEELALQSTSSGKRFGGDLVTAGINSARGLAAATLAGIVFADPARIYEALPVLDRYVDDPIAAVRTMAAELALACAAADRATGIEYIERLLDDDLVLSTSPAMRALRWAMLWDAKRFSPLLTRALAADEAKEAGSVWANCYVNDSLGSVPVDVAELAESARVGVADAIAPNPALAPELVMELLTDESSEVRREAARSLHFLHGVDAATTDHFIAGLLDSEFLSESAGDLLDALEEMPGELPELALEVCRRAIDWTENLRPRGIGLLAGNLVAVLIRLYRSAGEARREVVLDLIDRTVLLHIWRLDETLDSAR